MARKDYIPAKDTDLQVWALNFNTVVGAAPTDYGITAGQMSAFNTLYLAFAAALAAALNPGTRTSVTVAAKDNARNTMVASARQLAQVARRYPGITDELLSDAGLTVPDAVPSPIPAPTTLPVLSLMGSTSLQQTIRYRDSVLSNPRSRPDGAIGMQLFKKVSATPVTDINAMTYAGLITRMPAVIDFETGDAGKSCYYIGQWVTAKGLVGPQSDVFSATVAA
jgi:hypothetical protein